MKSAMTCSFNRYNGNLLTYVSKTSAVRGKSCLISLTFQSGDDLTAGVGPLVRAPELELEHQGDDNHETARTVHRISISVSKNSGLGSQYSQDASQDARTVRGCIVASEDS